MPTMHEVKSSNIKSIGHENGELHVTFHSGHSYKYKDVPEHVYLELMGSHSKGSYFSTRIKGVYESEKL